MISRRSILRGLAAVPFAGEAVARAAKTASLAAAPLLSSAAVEVAGSAPQPYGNTTFASLADWLSGGGEQEIRDRARNNTEYDHDLLSLRLPMPTIARMQYQRNLKREREKMCRSMLAMLAKNGKIEWWFDRW